MSLTGVLARVECADAHLMPCASTNLAAELLGCEHSASICSLSLLLRI